MIQIKNILILVFLVTGFSSCIEFFHPDLGNSTPKYVIDGQITDQEGFQTVLVSTTSTMEKPTIHPLSFCNVVITDNLDNEFKLTESLNERGKYSVWMGKEYLKPGNSYQVKVVTASGIEIVSDFDQLPECPRIDSIYYIRKDYPTSDPGKMLQGIQFYTDLDRGNTNSKYYRWEVVETWEHHAVYPITWFSKGTQVKFPPDYSRFFCWTTKMINSIYTLSTEGLAQNKYKMNPLHLVDNQSQRLSYSYSALFYQYAISEPAYKYWNDLQKNSKEQGGLYNTQPLHTKGNLKNTTNPEQEVLGFFSASSVKSKRIFVRNLENFEKYEPVCTPPRLPIPQIKESFEYMIELGGVKYILDDGCVECDYFGGSTNKPSYWPY